MDGVREQLVKKQNGSSDGIKKVLVLAAALVLAIIVLAFIISMGQMLVTQIGLLVAIGIIWGGWWLTGQFNVEYEYIIYGGELQIDKIVNKRSRKTLCSMNLRSAEAFYKSQKSIPNATEINVCGEGDRYTIEFSDPQNGKCIIVFTPDERTLDIIKPYLPRAI